MIEITKDLLNEESYFLYIHTPFCGTCHMARAILNQIEAAHQKDIFYEMNASLFPAFMQQEKVESVPCLFIKQGNEVKEKVYVFHSAANIYHYLLKYKPALFQS